ncbi:MAG TPA: hypothetical protein VGB13_09580 [Candidatus Krumholzibacteria bacterium]|jgi:hypothetical protein
MPLTRAHRLSSAAARVQRPLRYLFLEALLIALGVALALLGQEWLQQRHERALSHTALASIREELSQNRELIREAQEYHEAKMTLVRGHLGPDATPLPLEEFPRGFVAPAQLFDVAWQTARETDALSHLPYGRVLELAKIYAAQESYRLQAERSGELIYADLYAIGARGIAQKPASLMSLLGAFVYRERALLAEFDAGLPKILEMDDPTD